MTARARLKALTAALLALCAVLLGALGLRRDDPTAMPSSEIELRALCGDTAAMASLADALAEDEGRRPEALAWQVSSSVSAHPQHAYLVACDLIRSGEPERVILGYGLLRHVAEGGHVEAALFLAAQVASVDARLSFNWYQVAARRDDPVALTQCAFLIRRGVRQDAWPEACAEDLLRRAAGLGYQPAMATLAAWIRTGEAAEREPDEATRWEERAR